MATKYQEVAEQLKNQIINGLFDGGRPFPTEQTITETYGVSRQTVRQALGILVEEGLIVRRQGSGTRVTDRTQLPSAPRRTIAVITTYIRNYIFPEVLQEIETVLSENNCTTLLFSTQNQVSTERRVLQTILNQSVDGIIVEGTKTSIFNPNLDLYQQIIAKGIPMVFVHGYYRELSDVVTVIDDNEGGGRMLVDYLIGKGHTQIAGIFKSDDLQGNGRYAGYASALRDATLPIDDRHVFWYHTELMELLTSDNSPLSLLDTLQDCSAVVCYNDEIANFICTLLTKRGVRIPEDMAVVSFDNSHYSEFSQVPITSLTHDPYNTGRVAAEKLIKLLHGEECQSEAVGWTIVERQSG